MKPTKRLSIFVFTVFALILAPGLQSAAHAKATWSFDSPDAYTEDETRVNVVLRGGAGTLFGPGFKTGQPEYAKEGPFDVGEENRKPFGAGRQAITTVGAAVTAELSTEGPWAFGLTGLAGFNATASNNTGSITDDLLIKDQLQGPTVGVGTRVRYGDNDHGITLDVTYSKTHLNGSVRWNSEGFWEDGGTGSARYSYDVQKYNALLGYELTLKGPLFGFAQAGVQYMPKQTSDMTQTGVVPHFDDEDAFQDDIGDRRLTEIDQEVTFQGEVQYGFGAGVGVRF